MNLANILEHGRRDAPALVYGTETWTYGALRAAVADLAIRLSAEGLDPGDHVGLLAANNPGFVVGAFAALTVGLVVVPLNPQSPPLELTRELALTEVRVVLADDSAMIEHRHRPRALGVDRMIAIAPQRFAGPAPVAPRPVNVDADAPAFLLFTSGTAGPPAAATLLHRNLRANLDQVAAHPDAAVIPADVVLGVAPLGHVFGLNAVLNPALDAGACVVLVEHFDPMATLAVIGDRRVTIVSGPPALWDALADACHDPTVFANVRLALSGAAPLERRTVDAVDHRCGLRLQQGYGLTEAAPVVALAVGTEAPATSVGVPLAGLEVRIVDELGADVLIGDEGELWVRGPNVFAGYWGDPDATDRALTQDGWLRTGDIAVVDENGWISLVDRMKDLIIVSGFNVHPGEVESVLLGHPAVRDAAVTGVPHPGTGERVEASVVLVEGASASVADLIEHCRERLARYKVPARVRMVDALPHGLTGKVLRRELRPPD